MGIVIAIANHQERKSEELAACPPLECPRCDALCPPIKIDTEGAVHHRCQGHGHRPIIWRIAADGTMLHGAKSSQAY